MENKQNSHEVWDVIWENYEKTNIDELKKDLIFSKESSTWKKYSDIVNNKFGGWQNVISIELGSGMGAHSLMAASEGATVYLLDYSEIALQKAQKRFELLNLKGNFLYGNAFDLDLFQKANFNLSWSFGTAEHFSGQIRNDFFKLHFDYLSNDGITIISCPYKYAINYRIWMFYAVKFNEWSFGLEIPYAKSEYLNRLKKINGKLIEVYFDEGRPCLVKAINILKRRSPIRYYSIGYLLKLFLKFKIKISPFYYRSVILIAEKK